MTFASWKRGWRRFRNPGALLPIGSLHGLPTSTWFYGKCRYMDHTGDIAIFLHWLISIMQSSYVVDGWCPSCRISYMAYACLCNPLNRSHCQPPRPSLPLNRKRCDQNRWLRWKLDAVLDSCVTATCDLRMMGTEWDSRMMLECFPMWLVLSHGRLT